jgi:dTMP kinase
MDSGGLPSDAEPALGGPTGVFITFEGLDGTGKTTQMEHLAASIREHGFHVVTTREPGGTVIGEVVRRALLDARHTEMSARAEALLYIAARAQLVHEVIRPALEAGVMVLSDRYIDSSLAYQGYGRELGADDVILLNMWAVDGLFPQLTIMLTMDEETRRQRAGLPTDRLENEDDSFFQRVAEGYRRLVRDHRHRIREVDGSGTVDEVTARVHDVVEEELQLFSY